MIGTRKKKLKYAVGDIFIVSSTLGRDYYGQVAADTASEIGATFCYFYSRIDIDPKGDVEPLSPDDIIAAGFITAELIEHGEWRIICNMRVPMHDSMNQLRDLRLKHFIGCRITGSGLVADYLDTYYGALNRSIWPDPGIVDSFFLRRG